MPQTGGKKAYAMPAFVGWGRQSWDAMLQLYKKTGSATVGVTLCNSDRHTVGRMCLQWRDCSVDSPGCCLCWRNLCMGIDWIK